MYAYVAKCHCVSDMSMLLNPNYQSSMTDYNGLQDMHFCSITLEISACSGKLQCDHLGFIRITCTTLKLEAGEYDKI